MDSAQFLTEAAPWLRQYGYLALATAVMLEGVGIPSPGVVLMGGAALLAGQGELHLTLVWVTAWLATIGGDNLGYWIGRWGGRRLFLRAGVSLRRLARFEGFFRRFGVWLILFGRFFDGTRQLDGLIAGGARMPWPRFFAADLAGATVWVTFWVVGMYTLEHHMGLLRRALVYFNPWVATAAVIALGATAYWLLRAGRQRC